MLKEGHFHNMRKMLHVELELSPEQDAKIEIIQKDFKHASHPIFKDIEERRKLMIKELSGTSPDTAVLYKLSDDIGNLHNRLKHEAFKRLLQIRAICNSQQIQKLNIITMKLLEPEGTPGKNTEGKWQSGEDRGRKKDKR